MMLLVAFCNVVVCAGKQREGVGEPQKENVVFCFDVCHREAADNRGCWNIAIF